MKSNGKIKGLIIGIIIGAMLSCLAGYAITTGNLYDVINSGVKIVIDGKELIPTNVNGERVEPFIYNGTTYLPVRAVATALNKAVYWDGSEFTVYLGEMDGKLEYPTERMVDMKSISDSPESTQSLTDNYGNRYSSAIINYKGHASMEYLLNMRYSRFKGTLYIPNGQTSGDNVYLTIKADGKIIYTSPELTKTSYPVPVDVSVKGYNDVVISFSGDFRRSGDGRIWGLPVCLADAGFYQ